MRREVASGKVDLTKAFHEPDIVPRKQRPIIYACSGCSDVAQLANDAAVMLDHAGDFEMSCISGVGGRVQPLLAIARSGRPTTVIDGCPLHCARTCLENAGVTPDDHVRLYEMGFKKHYGKSYGDEAVSEVCELIRQRTDDHVKNLEKALYDD